MILPAFALRVIVVAVTAVGAVGLMKAEDLDFVFKTGRELLARPSYFTNKKVTITKGYCFFDDTQTMIFTCIGDETPFEVQANAMPAGTVQDAIKEKCGDIQGIEHNPTRYCAVSFRFVPTSHKTIISDYVVHNLVKSDVKIIHFDAALLEAFR